MTATGQSPITYGFTPIDQIASIVQGGQTSSFTYDPLNRMSRRSLPNNTTTDWSFDDAGSLTSLVSKKSGVTFDSHLYTPDPVGHIVQENHHGTLTKFLSDGDSVVSEVTGTTTVNTLQSPVIDQPLSRNGRFFAPNELGSTTKLTDALGGVVQSYDYSPFGETTQSTGEANPFQYAGRENDGTGLYYNRHRYYVPEWGRFMSEDPLGFAGGLNRYTYADNNPLSATDPSGMDWLNRASNFAAGWGDALTMGGTRWIRRLLGVDDIVDDGSLEYLGARSSARSIKHSCSMSSVRCPLGPRNPRAS